MSYARSNDDVDCPTCGGSSCPTCNGYGFVPAASGQTLALQAVQRNRDRKLLDLRMKCANAINAIEDVDLLQMIDSTIRHSNDPEYWNVRVSITRKATAKTKRKAKP